jgi:AraC-like DNA-binding protein
MPSKEIKNYTFKSGTALQVEIVPLKTLTALNKEHLIIPHRTDFYHVFLFENCSPTHFVDFSPVKIKPYTLLFISKDRVHQFDRLLKYDGNVLIFTDDFFCTTDSDAKFLGSTILFNDLTDKLNLQLDKKAFNQFISICNSINAELKLPDDNSKHDILKNLLHNFLLLADREKRKDGFSEIKKGADLDYTLLFKDLLEKSFTGLKNVSAYAEKLHVSEKRLGQATSKVLGKTPKELINARTLLEAKRLLVHGNQSIKEIGFQLGFEEPTNFIKYFRKHTNKTPVEFRESYLSI